MARRRMSSNVDKHVFSNTAVSTKKINLSPVAFRGGIRL